MARLRRVQTEIATDQWKREPDGFWTPPRLFPLYVGNSAYYYQANAHGNLELVRISSPQGNDEQ